MPKVPSVLHPLRNLRALLPTGKRTQEEFAALVGVSAVAIRKIEAGKLPISEKMSSRIMLATGVDPRSLTTPGETLRTYDLTPYSKETFLNHSARSKTRSVDFGTSYLRHQTGNRLFLELSALLESAWYANMFDQVCCLFETWVLEALEELNLESAFHHVGEAHGVPGYFLLDLYYRQMRKKGGRGKIHRQPSQSEASSAGPWLHTKSKSPFGEWLRQDDHPSTPYWQAAAKQYLREHPEVLDDPENAVVPEEFGQLHPALVKRSTDAQYKADVAVSRLFDGLGPEAAEPVSPQNEITASPAGSSKTSSPRSAGRSPGKPKK